MEPGGDLQGYIKMYRKALDNPVICKDSDHFAIWMYLLLSATHKEIQVVFGGEKITMHPGQLVTGRKVIATNFSMSESKVQRVLKTFEIEHQIKQQMSNKNRLITVLGWDKYQSSEQQTEQQLNNKRTTTEQQLNTNKNVKNDKNIKNNTIVPLGTITAKDILEMYHSTLPSLPKVRLLTEARKKALSARRVTLKTGDDWREYFKAVSGSAFLLGANDRNWRADFDWLIKESNMAKVLEGKYEPGKDAKSGEQERGIKIL